MIVSIILGVLIGAVMGLTGAGGGILAVPTLVFGMGWTMQQAAPVALIAVSGSAAIGAFEGWRRKLVRYRAAFLMAAVGMIFTPLGVQLAHRLPQRWLTGLFAAVLVIVAVRRLRKHEPDSEVVAYKLLILNPDTGRFDWSWFTAALLGAIGALTGFMAGLLGVGGGFVMVPLLRHYTDVSMHGVVATSLMVIALVGSAGVASSLLQGTPIDLNFTMLFAAATAAGMLLGRRLSGRVAERQVELGFATMLLVIACALLFKSLF